MSKNIVVFSDGTGQEGGCGANTNIYRLFNAIQDRTGQQIAFYDEGLGTGWRKLSGQVGGAGISTNIKQCYRFIFDHFEAGDRIFLFGFSRGAATVRSLSAFIHHFGILPKSRPELIDQAWKIYKIRAADKRARRAQDFVARHHAMWTKIRFLGCFDTVAALGVPFKSLSVTLDRLPFLHHRFHDFRLSASVQHARQALAIDDERKTFHPILWDADIAPGQSLRQVWFSGMHTDVGGGYPEHALSDIALAWMRDQAVAQGLLLYRHQFQPFAADCNGHMHDSRGDGWSKLYRHEVRHWDPQRPDRPVLHRSVLQRTASRHNDPAGPYRPWILQLDYEVEDDR